MVEEARRAGRFVHAHAESSEGYINAAGVRVLAAHGMMLNDDAVNASLEKDIVLIPTLTISDVILKPRSLRWPSRLGAGEGKGSLRGAQG